MPPADAGLVPGRVGALLGAEVVRVADLTPPWGGSTRSRLVRAGGEEFVVQLGPRRAIARRARLTAELRVRAPWLPVPELVAAETNPPPGSQPFLVARRVAGISGRELLSDDEGAARLGAAMGRLLPGIAAVPAAGLRLSRTWADAGRLVAAATRWLAGAAPVLAPAEVGRLRGWIDRLPERYEDVRPVFAHGDFVPVNVLMRGGSAGVEAEVAALLDLERARIAHPLYDAARWWAVVGYHHPDRLEVAGRAFSATAGLVLDPRARADLAVLGALQLLEEISRAGGTGTLPRRTGMLRSYMRGTPSVAFSR